MILAKNICLEESYKSNRNILVLGVPGSGKSRGHVLPNLMDMDSSFVVLDPKGELYATAAKMLSKRGYEVQCVDFDDPMRTPDFYNPLHFIRAEDDILRMTDLLLGEQKTNTKDVFWPAAAQLLANALVSFIVNECNPDEQTLAGVLKLLRLMPTDEKGYSVMDLMIEDLKRKNPTSFAVEQYEFIKLSAPSEKTYASILISLAATFSSLMTPGIKYLTDRNTIDFRKLGHKKAALFVKSSDTDRSKDLLVSVLFQQAIDELCREADEQENHCLPVHVHFFLDDFGTNLTINRFDAAIAGMRSREMSCSVILQSEGQLRKMYGDAWTTLLGSCAAYVFLGSNDVETCHDIALRVNKPLGQVLYKERGDIYIFEQGKSPRKDELYDLKSHMRYPLLEDSSPTAMSKRLTEHCCAS